MRAPLAERLRPTILSEVVGQGHLLGPESLITGSIARNTPLSLLLWGPPGCGKTTLAGLYAKAFDARFLSISAIFSGTSDLKKILEEIENSPLLYRRTILFVDEIHRFNKAQQDVFLPALEKGQLILIGATTENPSFALNDALLSRLRVLQIRPLGPEALQQIVARYEAKIQALPLTEKARELLVEFAHGDGRHLLNMIENLEHSLPTEERLDEERLQKLLQRRHALYDRQADGHYNLISALHKSVRGSDPDASLYWFARMLEGGEDPAFLARRLIRMATEDIGLADPRALEIALAAWRGYDQLGSPEGELALAQAVVYLALAPKSNALYTAYKAVREAAEKTSHLPPPSTILNAPTAMMRNMGYGAGYQYDHDLPLAFSGQNYFPDGMERPQFYEPKEYGFEREMKKRVEYFENLRKKKPFSPDATYPSA
ncbi:MAG: replication-associated recombination protein A [Verrucomicrobia bacterium]|nr:replication-associated recombination protein A [Verrucomicrobiota bacterium]